MEGMFGRLIETIIEWFDEYYSINLSGEVLRGMTEKALREGYQATPCLGYRAVGEGKPFAVEEKSYAIVEYIFQTYHSGKDMTATARAANARGYRTRRGNLFDRRGINRDVYKRQRLCPMILVITAVAGPTKSTRQPGYWTAALARMRCSANVLALIGLSLLSTLVLHGRP